MNNKLLNLNLILYPLFKIIQIFKEMLLSSELSVEIEN